MEAGKLKARVSFVITNPDACTPDEFGDWVHSVIGQEGPVDPENVLSGIEFSFFDQELTIEIPPIEGENLTGGGEKAGLI